MFRRNLIPVWIGIILLSGMFLIGQEGWCPPPGTLADVLDVSVSGTEGAYIFSVRVISRTLDVASTPIGGSFSPRKGSFYSDTFYCIAMSAHSHQIHSPAQVAPILFNLMKP